MHAGGAIDALTADFLSIYLAAGSDPDLARIVRTSFADLRRELEDPIEDEAAKALEWFAAKVCWRLGLRTIEVRSLKVVGGIEVDVVADRSLPSYQRYLVQCKRHATRLGPPIIAKELGTATVEKIENILFVSTGGYTPSARAFRRQVMRETGKNILMLDEADVAAICADESRLYGIINRENAFCRAVRTGDDEFWLPLQMQWVVPGLIGDLRLAAGDAEAAWQAFREADPRAPVHLRQAFLDYYAAHFAALRSGEAIQLELPF